jgi:lipoprotein-anchoring transpeptidase ErfK/SrfK
LKLLVNGAETRRCDYQALGIRGSVMHRLVLAIAFALAASPAFAGLVPTTSRPGNLTITVDISTQSMVVKDGWRTIYSFDVSTGAKGYSTPTGAYTPIRMHEKWFSRKYDNAPMPWAIFFHGGYAIHGTTDLKNLGRIASHGCVRLDPKNAKKLFELVEKYGSNKTSILITG